MQMCAPLPPSDAAQRVSVQFGDEIALAWLARSKDVDKLANTYVRVSLRHRHNRAADTASQAGLVVDQRCRTPGDRLAARQRSCETWEGGSQ